MTAKTRSSFILLAAGLLLLAGALYVLLQQTPAFGRAADVDWDLAVVGRDGQQVTLSFRELRSLPSAKTSGGFFSSVGTIFGPYRLKGVPLDALCDMVGGLTETDVLFVAASDGYSAVYDYDQLTGAIDTFDPASLRLVPGGATQFLLIYEQDGAPLTHENGKPLRLAITNPDGLITEGHWWVKWVTRLEIRRAASAPQAER